MKKKFLSLIFAALIISTPVFAKVDKMSEEYLKNNLHFSFLNPPAEFAVERAIKKSIKKQYGTNFKVKFEGYTLQSMKRGMFKNLELTGRNINIEGIDVPYIKVKTVSDFNIIDYKQDPVIVKSDLIMAYNIELSEKTINQALNSKEYKKVLEKVNKYAYPLFTLHDVRVRIRHDKIHIIMEYNFPIAPSKQNKTFMVSTDMQVVDGKLAIKNIGIDNAYGNISVAKVSNLVNLLDPLSFTLSELNSQKCNGKAENVKIVDNIVKINGKIFVKGE